MTGLKKPAFVSIEDYLAGKEIGETKHEYLGGAIHAMASGTNDHAAVAANAVVALGSRLRGKPSRPFGSDTKVRIELPEHTRFYYPDVQVVCNRNPGNEQFQENPVVVIEVLSDSTRRTDLGEKRQAYLTIPSLKVLILIESDDPRVTAYRRQPHGGFTVEEYAGTDAVIALPEIEAELPLAELYEGLSHG
ncbi:MAG: Uma2 family endonuclease [Verrucomicrobiota bacterium]